MRKRFPLTVGSAFAVSAAIMVCIVFGSCGYVVWLGAAASSAREDQSKRQHAYHECLSVLEGLDKIERCERIIDPNRQARRAVFKKCLETQPAEKCVEVAP